MRFETCLFLVFGYIAVALLFMRVLAFSQNIERDVHDEDSETSER